MRNRSYYDDSEGGAPTETPPEHADDGDSSGGRTTLLPKSVFGGRELNPGDKGEFEVVRVQEDAYEVTISESEEEQKPPQPEESPEGGGDEGGDSMAGMME